jgi:hypothetical protein
MQEFRRAIRAGPGTFTKIQDFEILPATFRRWKNMPNPTFRRWIADDIAKLKKMAQAERPADIAVNGHELNLSLRTPRNGAEEGSATDRPAPPAGG